mmetsp:Transcript_19703/g.45336  ORF Transcript_19703/g.45336 Transcript_19703/m.45336 type:complete len:222 (-) Transcript_19703:1315-1980(-)
MVAESRSSASSPGPIHCSCRPVLPVHAKCPPPTHTSLSVVEPSSSSALAKRKEKANHVSAEQLRTCSVTGTRHSAAALKSCSTRAAQSRPSRSAETPPSPSAATICAGMATAAELDCSALAAAPSRAAPARPALGFPTPSGRSSSRGRNGESCSWPRSSPAAPTERLSDSPRADAPRSAEAEARLGASATQCTISETSSAALRCSAASPPCVDFFGGPRGV